MTSAIEERLTSLGVTLPRPAAPAANYVPFVESRGMLYISGQIPVGPEGIDYIGRLGDGFDIEDGRKAARLCAINILAQARAALGDLDRVGRIVKLTGFVNAAATFNDHPKVVNGASDFMVEVFGERGRHARSAVGVAGLPFGVAVEVEAIIEIA
jgi:enamine deaminase RidA (YjgF/YER057c/UK114 family)